MTQISRALISVFDKTGLVELARRLHAAGVELVSTGSTAQHIADAGVPVTPIDQVTGFPEMMDGRVKTLHPKVHGAILADRSKAAHVDAMAEHGIVGIDLVIVNLYPFGGACSVGAAWAPDKREPSEQQRTLAPSPQARMREGSVYALVLSPSRAA